MARGFLSGAFWGLVVAGVGAGTASVLTGPVMAPMAAGDAMVPEAEAAVDAASTLDSQGQAVSDGQEAQDQQDTAGDAASAQTDALSETPAGDASSDAPEALEADAASDSTASQIEADETPKNNAAETSSPQDNAPEETGSEDSGAEAETPAEPAVETQEVQQTASVSSVASVAPLDDAKADDEPVIERVESNAQVPLPQAEPEPAPEAESGIDAVESDGAEGTNAQTADTGPSVGSGASDLSKLAPGIATGRLPSVGGSDGEAAQTPFEAFAAPVDVADGKPLMSIVLVDDGSTPLGLEALEAFPYPLTFAIDTEWPDAQEAMERYRAAGFEVMALANIPQGAQASDVEVTLRAALDTVPQGVAVLEGDRSGLQGSRDVSDQVAQILADTGHGLVLYPKGLNTAVSLAQREGVPAQSLFRDFDGQGQNASVIRRFLDQAAFKAGQEGGVVMLGRLRAETISALLIWGLQDRATSVALVPVSQVLSQP